MSVSRHLVDPAQAPLKPKHIWSIRQQLKTTGSTVRYLGIENAASMSVMA